jgi:hypothetical protein
MGRSCYVNRMGRCGLGSSGSGYGPVAGCCAHLNAPSGSIKGGVCVDYLSDCQLLKKDSTAWSWLVGVCAVQQIVM